jgi:hypothetical protein
LVFELGKAEVVEAPWGLDIAVAKSVGKLLHEVEQPDQEGLVEVVAGRVWLVEEGDMHHKRVLIAA